MHILFIGIQGSGKGTQIPNIEREFGYLTFQTGQIIRDAIAQDPDSEIARVYNSGGLVSDEMIAGLTRAFFTRHAGERVLLDGAVRTVPQKVVLDSITRDYCVIFLDLSEDEAIYRLGGRRMDPVTGEIFGREFVGETNPRTGNILVVRADDTPEGIRKRVEEYKQKTQPLLDSIGEDVQIPFFRIDASGSREQVWEAISRIIRENHIAE